jgi:hypothetical protein
MEEECGGVGRLAAVAEVLCTSSAVTASRALAVIPANFPFLQSSQALTRNPVTPTSKVELQCALKIVTYRRTDQSRQLRHRRCESNAEAMWYARADSEPRMTSAHTPQQARPKRPGRHPRTML